MSVYADDLLMVAAEETLDAATQAISEVWAISDVEKTGEGNVVKYCGFEVESALDEQGLEDGFMVSQKKYEKDMIQGFGIEKPTDFPRFILQKMMKFQLVKSNRATWKQWRVRYFGSQQERGLMLQWLWQQLADCALCTKNPCKSSDVSNAIMQYIHGNQRGLHYPRGVPAET